MSAVVNTGLFLGYLDQSHKTRDLAVENRARIAETAATQRAIQRSRIHSCRQTYEAFHDVFRPFIRPPEQQTPKERADLLKFNKIIDELIATCKRQTRAAPPPPPTHRLRDPGE